MPFRYPLQPVLRLRVSIERQEEQRLFAIAAVVARLRSEIETLFDNYLQQKRAALQDLVSTSSGAALQFIASCDTAYASAGKSLQDRLQEAERQRLRQLLIYQAARQKREILEGLRDQHKADYDLEVVHQEQQTTDEAFLLRLHRDSNT